MWIPENAAEIENAALRGHLDETPIFDAKADLPVPKKNASLAVDVAAMSTDGGALLYGVAEDEHQRPTIPQPISLAGAADRAAQIVQTSIVEVPFIESREYPCEGDPSKGYLLLLIPPSSRAPHQVVVGGDLRFYGRGDKGNRILTEGEVARLYQRRQAWEQDREQLLAQTVAAAPFGPRNGLGYLHAFARPVAPDRSIWDRAVAARGGRDALLRSLQEVGNLKYWRRRGADAWRFSSLQEDASEVRSIRYLKNITVNVDGRADLFDGGVVMEVNPQYGPVDPGDDHSGPLLVFEGMIAERFEAFLGVIGELYRAARYLGPVDIGLHVTGLEGARSMVGLDQRFAFAMVLERDPFSGSSYPRTEQLAASELSDPRAIALRMLRHLFEATTGRDDFDPFASAS